ncbi:hypothetical protein Cflav_PD3221 [Pedosphaera parvula Ellin514]|uniref:Uncharacterized protein n=1 Tax=Pedosphaera parvula (strain Ellin514) TaxID=320771 RepID=B9XIT5_PEDPL|nr:hypothetical protein Cflav_PD3221 [Pedosphaera parvula Ellin514]
MKQESAYERVSTGRRNGNSQMDGAGSGLSARVKSAYLGLTRANSGYLVLKILAGVWTWILGVRIRVSNGKGLTVYNGK